MSLGTRAIYESMSIFTPEKNLSRVPTALIELVRRTASRFIFGLITLTENVTRWARESAEEVGHVLQGLQCWGSVPLNVINVWRFVSSLALTSDVEWA